jgi:YHS domain-containing protein
MKITKYISAIALTGSLLVPLAGFAADKKEKVKPYTLTNCVVSDEKLGGDMGKPYVFEYKGQEIKLCCKSCKKDFDKDPAKYIKKMEEEQKKAADKKSAPSGNSPEGHNH